MFVSAFVCIVSKVRRQFLFKLNPLTMCSSLLLDGSRISGTHSVLLVFWCRSCSTATQVVGNTFLFFCATFMTFLFFYSMLFLLSIFHLYFARLMMKSFSEPKKAAHVVTK